MHEMSNSVFWENKKNITSLSPAEFAHKVVKVYNIVIHRQYISFQFVIIDLIKVRNGSP